MFLLRKRTMTLTHITNSNLTAESTYKRATTILIYAGSVTRDSTVDSVDNEGSAVAMAIAEIIDSR